VARIGRREDEHRLRVIELACDGLHDIRAEPLGLQHHGERIAGKAAVGEHVERREMSAHWSSW
jgi:hypothetical protein